jgi:multiple sugar transport system permease protein
MPLNLSRKRRIKMTGIYLASGFIAFILVAPFIWMLISSVSSMKELTASPPHLLPQEPTLENYRSLFSQQPGQSLAASEFSRSLVVSIIVALTTTVFCLLVGVPAAYAFARLPFRGRTALFIIVIFAQMLPSIALVIPLYIVFAKIGLSNTMRGLVILYSTFTLPFVVWVMTGYFQSVPRELEEAATLDGAGTTSILLRIVLPITLPGLAAATVFSLLNAWSEFFLAVVFTSSVASKTMPVVISEFVGRFSVDYGAMNAAAVVGTLPPLIFALFLQKFIVSGLTAGAVKG